jgi:hypothetical protein
MIAGRGRRCLQVSIAIGSLDFPTILLSDIGDRSFLRCDGNGSFGFGCHPAYMHPRIVQVCWNMGMHDITFCFPLASRNSVPPWSEKNFSYLAL